MKAKNLSKKLTLNKQTMANLDLKQLQEAIAGRPPISYYHTEIGCCVSAKETFCFC